MATPTSHNPNPSLAAGGTSFLQSLHHCIIQRRSVCLSVSLSFHHILVFSIDEGRYDRAVYTGRYDSYSTPCSKKTSTHIIGYKLRNSCPILIIFDIKIAHII